MGNLIGHNIHAFVERNLEESKNAQERARFIKSASKENGLSILGNPSNTIISTLHNIERAIKCYDKFSVINYFSVDVGHGNVFLLVPSNTALDTKLKKHKNKKHVSDLEEIGYLGEFKIGEVQDGIIKSVIDFSLFKTKDDFLL